MGFVGAVDRFHRRHPKASIPLAVVYKFFEDQGNYLAAMTTYYAFIAIFPLMLLGTSILGFVLEGNPGLQQDILNSALGRFPIIGDQLGRPEGLQGSVGGIVVGSLAALYGAIGLGQALQNMLYVVWSVPRNSRPNPILQRLRSLILLMAAGLALLSVTLVSAIGAHLLKEAAWGGLLRWAIALATVVVIGMGMTILFRLASAHRDSLRRAAPGGFALAIMWQLLQYGGATYVDRVLVGASAMNRTFALVLGLMAFIFVGAIMAVLALEINVVLVRKLYPRALLTPFTDHVTLTQADRRAYRGYAKAQRHKGFETVEVTFDGHRDIGAAGPGRNPLPPAEPNHAAPPPDDASPPEPDHTASPHQ